MNVTPPQLRPPGPAGFIRPAPRDNRAAENNQTSNKLGRPRLAFHRGGTMKARLSRNQGNEKRGHVRAAESWPRISRQTSWPSRARITQSAESSSSIECTPNLPEARWGGPTLYLAIWVETRRCCLGQARRRGLATMVSAGAELRSPLSCRCSRTESRVSPNLPRGPGSSAAG